MVPHLLWHMMPSRKAQIRQSFDFLEILYFLNGWRCFGFAKCFDSTVLINPLIISTTRSSQFSSLSPGPLMILRMSKSFCNLSALAFVFCLSFYCSAAHAHSRGMYRTQAEAEKRATELKCKGTFRIDDAWMPCSSEHAMHEALQKN